MAFADSTKQAYRSHLKKYVNFCKALNIDPAPITSTTLVRYAAYLASSLSYSSIGKYLNIVRIIHRELGLPNPLEDNYALNVVLKGIKKTMGGSVSRKLPITPQILLGIRASLNLTKPQDVLFWAACLVSFFGLFRKSNVIPKSPSTFQPTKHFIVGDVYKCPEGLSLKVKWSKTIQFQERVFHVPLPFLVNHPLCPVTALITLLRLHQTHDPQAPLFSFGSVASVLTQPSFVNQLRHHLQKSGVPPQNYSGHSFRRGGASWAFEAGLPGEVIQSLGDWKSQAYLIYLEINLPSKFQWLKQFSTKLPYH